tara:strand:+ start:1108 stop:2508 length:1401 start_codon:yes stop_codon:yes gene_type:complete
VFYTVVETVEETSQNDGQGVLTTTVTTTTTTVDTVTNEDSGDLLDGGNGFVSSSKEGDMDIDWGGQGPASMPTGSRCGDLGTDKCAEITGSGSTTSTMGVPNMGTTFKQTIDVQNLNIDNGGKTTYTIKVDKQDASDSIYIHITGKDGSATQFSGTDFLSASGVNSGYSQYTGSFNFHGGLTSILLEVGGRDINLDIGPVFDDVSVNVLYNVISRIVQQTITTVESYVYLNSDATQEEISIVEDIFEHNDIVEQPDGMIDFEPIQDTEVSYETVELEMELPDFEVDFEVPEIEMQTPEMVDIEIEVDLESVDMEMEIDVVQPEPVAEPEPEVEPEPVDEPKVEKTEVKQEPKEEPKKETKVAEKKPEPKQTKAEQKQKAAGKIINKMGDKGRYDETNQLKTLLVMQVLGNTKDFFSSQLALPDTPGFFSATRIPDTQIKDNGLASFVLFGGSNAAMDNLVNMQYKR